jgi:hypothetical protein
VGVLHHIIIHSLNLVRQRVDLRDVYRIQRVELKGVSYAVGFEVKEKRLSVG